MRSPIARVTLKIIELLGCIACFVTKVITDLEARRVFLRNQKYSREWSLLHNVTWSSAGNTFANITYGGFSLITALMLISRCIDANSRPSIIEKTLLIVGMLCFFAMGGLVLAAFDQVPYELYDNSIILGCLSFFVALVMLYDLADPIARHVTDTTQTDNDYTVSEQSPQQQQQPTEPQQIVVASGTVQPISSASNQTSPLNQSHQSNVFTEIVGNDVNEKSAQPSKPSIEKVAHQTQTDQTMTNPTMHADIGQNGNYHRGDAIDFVHFQHMPQPEQPVFERVLMPEKKRPTYNKVADPHKAMTINQNVRTEGYIPRETHFDSTINSNQMPKYAAVQRQQTPTSYSAISSPMYKLSRNYEHNDYERPPIKHTIGNEYERSIPKYTSTRSMRSNDLNRYNDQATEHYQNQQPMMVIRNYGHSMPTQTPIQSVNERRHHHHTNDSVYHRNGGNGTRKPNVHHTQLNARKNECCGPNTDDEVDFRKCDGTK